MKIFKKKHYNEKIIFVSGLTRSGKSLLCSILSTLTKNEKFNMNFMLENIFQLTYLKKINLETSTFLIKTFCDLLYYDQMIGRNVNFRPGDYTSVWNTKNPKEFLMRLKKKEGISILDEIKKEKNYFTLMIHNGFLYTKIIEKLFKDFRFINIERSPIMLAEEWYIKNYFNEKSQGRAWWGGYLNPRHSVLLLDSKKTGVPYFLNKEAKQFLKLSKMDSIIFNIKNLRKKQELITLKKNYYVCCFENLSFKTYEEIKKIKDFLKVEETKFTNLYLEHESCPRYFSKENYKKVFQFVKSKSSKKYFDILLTEEKKHIKKFNLIF